MTRQELASILAKLEGKKSQARIGDLREILRLLVEFDADFVYEHGHPGPLDLLGKESDALIHKMLSPKPKRRAKKISK